MTIKRYIEGLKFGLLLQFAIGPMCLMVFNTAKNSGFLIAFSLVIAITLVDAFYIALAAIGASKILENKKVNKVFKILGSIVLVLFGTNIILNVFGINILPGMNLKVNTTNIFIQGLILTLSNPITIIFWGSVLTTKIIDDNLKRKELLIFYLGLVLATLFFLSLVAISRVILSNFISGTISNILNILVGILIIYFGIKLLIKKS